MPMFLFLIGLVEMVIATVWTRVVSRGEMAASGIVTFVNILIWYYVLQQVVEDISNWRLIFLYAVGCALGTVIGTWYFAWREKRIAPGPVRGKNTSADAPVI